MSSRKIEDLHPALQETARQFIKEADQILEGWQAFITDGFRSNEEQDKLYAQGRSVPGNIVTHARAGQSPHNYGLAVDIAFRKDGTKDAQWLFKKYSQLDNLAIKLGLVWGGTWKNFKDYPHFELKNWKEIKNNKKEVMQEKPPTTMMIEIKDFDKMHKNSTTLDQLCNALGIEKNSNMQKITDTWVKEKENFVNEALKKQKKKYTEKVDVLVDLNSQYTRGKIAEALEVGPGETLEDLVHMVKDLKDQSKQPRPSDGNDKPELPATNSIKSDDSPDFRVKTSIKSKTIWFNIVMTIISTASFVISLGSELPKEVVLGAVFIQGFGNIILRRWFTDSKLA